MFLLICVDICHCVVRVIKHQCKYLLKIEWWWYLPQVLCQNGFSFWYMWQLLTYCLCQQIFWAKKYISNQRCCTFSSCPISSWSNLSTVGTWTFCFTSWSFKLHFRSKFPSSTRNLSNILSNGLWGNWSVLGLSPYWNLSIQGHIFSSSYWSWIQSISKHTFTCKSVCNNTTVSGTPKLPI